MQNCHLFSVIHFLIQMALAQPEREKSQFKFQPSRPNVSYEALINPLDSFKCKNNCKENNHAGSKKREVKKRVCVDSSGLFRQASARSY